MSALLEALSPFLELASGRFGAILSLVVRLSALAAFAPLLAERTTPVRVRMAAVVAFTVILLPLIDAEAANTTLAQVGVTAFVLAEAGNGLLIGFSLRVTMFAIQVAGAYIGQILSVSQAFGGSLDHEQSSAVAMTLVAGALGLAAIAGLHFHVAAALAQTWLAMPAGLPPGADAAGEWAADRAAFAFAAGLALASPFVALGLVYSLALTGVARAMPQLPAAFVGSPALALAGLLLLAAAAPVMLSRWLALTARLIAELPGAA